MRHHVRVRLDPLQETEIFEPRHDLLARSETIDAVQFFRKCTAPSGKPRK